jgi:hypothetical protein
VPDGYRLITEGRFAGEAVPEHLYDFATGLTRASSPEGMAQLKASYDAYTRWWASWSLAVRPAFHTRNAVGNFWNNFLGGVWNPQHYAYATILQTSPEAAAKLKLRLGNGVTKTLAELGQEAEVLGASATQFAQPLERMRANVQRELEGGSTWGGMFSGKARRAVSSGDDAIGKAIDKSVSELPEGLQRAGRVARAVVPFVPADEATSMYIQAGLATGGAVEGNARIAHYIAKRMEGLTPEQAAMSVKKHLFDYSELTDFERSTLKRVMPFYSWMRNNVPLQVESLLKQPGKFATKEKLISALEDDSAPDRELYPEWMRKAGIVRRGPARNGVALAYTRAGYDPSMDIGRYSGVEGGFTEAFLGSLHPLAKAALAQVMGADPFRPDPGGAYKPLSGLRSGAPGLEGRKVESFGSLMSNEAAFALDSVLPVAATEIKRLNPGNAFGEAAKAMTEGGVRVDRGGSPPWLHIPGIDPAENRDRPDPSGWDRLTQYLLGVRPYQADLSAEARRRVSTDQAARREQLSIARQERQAGHTEREGEAKRKAALLLERMQATRGKFEAAGIPLYPDEEVSQ